MKIFGEITGFLKSKPDVPFREDQKAALKLRLTSTQWIAMNGMKDREEAGAVATPYLRLMGLTVIAWLWSLMANEAQKKLESGAGDKDFLKAKLTSAQFYFEKILPEINQLSEDIASGKESLMGLTELQF